MDLDWNNYGELQRYWLWAISSLGDSDPWWKILTWTLVTGNYGRSNYELMLRLVQESCRIHDFPLSLVPLSRFKKTPKEVLGTYFNLRLQRNGRKLILALVLAVERSICTTATGFVFKR